MPFTSSAKIRTHSLLPLLFLLPSLSIFSQEKLSGPFQLQGDVSAIKGAYQAFISTQDTEGNYHKDSVLIKNGHFVFKGRLSEPEKADLWITTKVVLETKDSLIGSGGVELFLEPGIISLRSGSDFNHPVITGSPLNRQYETFNGVEQAYVNKIMSGINRYNTTDTADHALRDSLNKVVEQMRQDKPDSLYKPFILAHLNEYIGAYALQIFSNTHLDPEKLESLYRQIPEKYLELPSGQKLRKQIDLILSLSIGQPAKDFVQPDTAGRPVSLSSFKGKYLLLDFWASWCGPCRAENPIVVKAFQAYKDRNFTILSVSLDANKEFWINAVRKDGLAWTQVGDMQWQNKAAALYDIAWIPSNLLIDPAGFIIAKNLHGDELEKKLKEVLGRP